MLCCSHQMVKEFDFFLLFSRRIFLFFLLFILFVKSKRFSLTHTFFLSLSRYSQGCDSLLHINWDLKRVVLYERLPPHLAKDREGVTQKESHAIVTTSIDMKKDLSKQMKRVRWPANPKIPFEVSCEGVFCVD